MIVILFLTAFLLRIIISFLPGFQIDMTAWYGWAFRLGKVGFAGFYNSDIWTNYTPGYLYVLWFLEKAKEFLLLGTAFNEQLFKLPGNIADLITAFLIYKVVAAKNQKLALPATALYLFNPALIFNTSAWGQVDSFLTIFILMSFYLLIEKKKAIISSFALALAILIKPQALFVLPVFVFFLFKKFERITLFKTGAVLIATVFLLALPFFPANPFIGLPALVWQMGKDYPYATLNAFNFWQLWGNLPGRQASWQPDSVLFLGISKQVWGIILVAVLQVLIIRKLLINKKQKIADWYYAGFLSIGAFFFLATRMHERYLLPALCFLLLAAALKKSYFLFFSYLFVSFLHFVNLYWVYNLYQPSFLKISWLQNIIGSFAPGFSLLSVFWFTVLLVFYLYPRLLSKVDSFLRKFTRQFLHHPRRPFGSPRRCFLGSFSTGLPYRQAGSNNKVKKIKSAGLLLGLILVFTFLTRIINLGHPKAYVFDEVYHAFTAQEMVKGNPAAWEWWNSSPKGFAYEWTHPPLAKFFMAGGIVAGRSLGIDSDFVGWRFPAAVFGVGVVFLAYQLAKKLFLSEKIALLAAFFLSCDGLVFVLSRIGMSDIYFTFFALLAILMAMNKKWMLMGLSWGMALAVKWTGLYLALPLFFIFVCFNWKKRLVFLKWLMVVCLAAGVYFFSYLPFFTSGHSFEQFSQLHRQMWGYHTRLKATHSYQSPAYTWPLDMRPVWFWVEHKETLVSNIYALGNPIIFWPGLVFLPLFFYYAFFEKRLYLLLVLICYFVFWLPWVFSPRVMFMYHYLPAVPFLAMILAWGLGKLNELGKLGKFLFWGFLVLVLVSFFFFYPLWAGTPIHKDWLKFFFWLPSWK